MQLQFLPVFAGKIYCKQETTGSRKELSMKLKVLILNVIFDRRIRKRFLKGNVAGMRQFYMAYKDGENEIIQSGWTIELSLDRRLMSPFIGLQVCYIFYINK